MLSIRSRAGRARTLGRGVPRRLLLAAMPLPIAALPACSASYPVPVSAASAVTAPAATAPAATAAVTATKPTPTRLGGREWTTVRTSSKIVALTFDAGANADGVSSILATLKAKKVPATFFLTGDFVQSFRGKARAIVAAGMRVGDHSITHPYFTKLKDWQMRNQVLGAEQRIISATGADPWPWFRFPFGDRNARTIAAVNSFGFVPIGWTVDTMGWKGTSGGITVQTVINRVVASARPGEIVLMHCGSNPTDHSTLDARALPTVIDKLRHKGYTFVTLDAMLGYRILLGNGDVRAYGSASFGSLAGRLPAGVRAVAVTADHATGGYWVLKSNGGVENFNAPWYGSLAGKLAAGARVTAIAAGRGGGYYVLTSDGGVHAFGARGYGSMLGRLPAGVTAVALATDPATGGYWIAKSDGGVESFRAPWYGSLAGMLRAGQSVLGITGQ